MRTLVIFDFDGTLIKGDSLWLFLKTLCGRGRAIRTFVAALCAAPATNTFWYDPRTAIKKEWLERLLGGVPANEATLAAEQVRAGLHWLQPQIDALKQHAANGADIIVATGALDCYIDTLLEGLPIKTILATAMEQTEGGMLTGRMLGNAVRGAKGKRVAAYIKANGAYDHIVGYGNLPHDRQMLDLCTEQHVV